MTKTPMPIALELATRGSGRVSPNPLVGAVLVKDGRVVGRGWHPYLGGPHAEAMALAQAGRRAKGADLYVTLEPCAHEGRTPSCAHALVRAGVRRVYASIQDPDPRTSGRGFAILRQAGIKVQVGLGEVEAEAQNEAYLLSRRAGRSFVHLKLALSQDLKIAPAGGRRVMFSSPESQVEAHRLRADSDAVLVGVRTVIQDDPRLDARLVPARRQPRPVILDPRLRISLESRCLAPQRQPIIFCADSASPSRRRRLEDSGASVIAFAGPRFSFQAIARSLYCLGLSRILVEGGGLTASAALRSGCVDRMTLFLVPQVLGPRAVPAFPGLRVLPMSLTTAAAVGTDLRLEYRRILSTEAAGLGQGRLRRSP